MIIVYYNSDMSDSMRILILLGYYNRPILVRNALSSVLAANEHHSNWELGFGDDGSYIPGRPIVEELMRDHMNKVIIRETGMTFEDKVKNGIMIGKFANEVISTSFADIGILLCDDDELEPMYLKNLSNYFLDNKDVLYAYSKIHLYNPLIQKSGSVKNCTGKYNQWSGQIDPVGRVDASQVAWRLDCCKKHGAWLPETTKQGDGRPWIKDTDRSFFENLRDKCGLCHSTGFISQFKGIHDYQLVWHKNVSESDLRSYDEMCKSLGGVKF